MSADSNDTATPPKAPEATPATVEPAAVTAPAATVETPAVQVVAETAPTIETPVAPAIPETAPTIETPVAPPVEPSVATPVASIHTEATAPIVRVSGVELHMVGRTDVGLVREHNEDNFACVKLDGDVRDPQALLRHTLGARGTLLVVCDGMGGAAAGEVASQMAVETLPEIMLGERTGIVPANAVDDELRTLARQLRFAAEEANRRIFAEQQANVARSGMGTTMTAALLRDRHAVIAQVGDSRAYFYRRGTLTQVTRDQSLVNQLLETGQITAEQAKYFEHSNVILQALGVQEDVEVQLSRVELRRGDRVMLCSDGLVGVVSDEEIAAVMGSVEDPAECARILIELANAGGGPDNITVVVAYLAGDALPEPTADDAITYETWVLDPPPLDTSTTSTTAPGSIPALDEQPFDRVVMEPPPPAPPVTTSPLEVLSMAVVIGIMLGSVIIGFAMYRRAVPCTVHTQRAGLIVVTDGRDSGARTIGGDVPLRLRPGRHRVGLVAPRGARGEVQPGEPELEVEVRQGERCWVSFEREANAAPEPTPAGVEAEPAAAPEEPSR